jgi:hypothetical protein
MGHLPMFLAYLGPETMLPLTSIIAGSAGVVMMFGRRFWLFARSIIRRLSTASPVPPQPLLRTRRIGQGPIGRIESVARRESQVEN